MPLAAGIDEAGRGPVIGPLVLAAVQLSAQKAFRQANVHRRDIDLFELHDAFSIMACLSLEAVGFAEPGHGPQLIRNKETYKEGKIPVNVDGGLLSKGHPIGATGGSQIRTIVLQLRGEAGEMQVPGPKIGLVHNIGGVGIYGNVTIFGTD